MEPIKKVAVFTLGDSGRLATWSNMPFFFTETLIAKGIIMNILENNLYPVLCSRVHNAVKTFTWDACTGMIIAKIEQLID
ncbi:MAG: hypothetical protein LBD80_09350 [Tannerella sp.]|jgi:hypothetical protein|nr:hypothetical protein [Tannerella sp.]